ncbi:hypothetical protein [Pseudoduganella danionis]|uniref:hypothetical protein n=1 Tax=Pseudoduganella danionis TaxID=1890295 RepID=UPI0035B446B1
MAVVAMLAASLSGCGGGSSGAVTPPSPPPVGPQTVSLKLSGNAMLGNAPVTISATLDHSAEVSWTLANGNLGSLSATSGTSVIYTPPATRVTVLTPVTITATSAGVSRNIRLTLYPAAGAPGLSLIAGDLGGRSVQDGTASAARFNDIAAIASDSDGSMIVVDLDDSVLDSNPSQFPSVIRRVTADGLVTTLYRPAFGHADGPAGTAKLGRVAALAVTSDHGLFVLDNDTTNNYVRRIEPDGSISTVATLGMESRFSTGTKLTTDASGHLRLISNLAVYALQGGKPVLLAGQEMGGEGSVDGEPNLARFSMIIDSVSDSAGNIYMIDNYAIRKVAPTGQTSTIAGVANSCGGVDGTGSVARFGAPVSLSLDKSGNLLVLDRDICGGTRTGYQIRQVTPAGVVTTPSYGTDPTSSSYLPNVATATRNRLLRVSSDNRVILASSGQLQVQQSTSSASLLAGLEGNSYSERDGAGAVARFVNPYLLSADLNGNLYVIDSTPGAGGYQLEIGGILLRKINAEGVVSSIPVSSQLVPTGMVTDSDGNVYISVRGPLSTLIGVAPGGAVYKVTAQGNASIWAGSQQTGTGATPVDGTGSNAVFVRPTVLGVDSEGNVYLKDENFYVSPSVSTFRKISPQGQVSTIPALPDDLDKAPDGYRYTADPERSVIYRLAADGNKTVAAGVVAQRGTRLGQLPGGLDRPRSLVPTGPGSFAVISGAAVLRLALPQ